LRQGSSDVEKETKQIGSLDAGADKKFTVSSGHRRVLGRTPDGSYSSAFSSALSSFSSGSACGSPGRSSYRRSCGAANAMIATVTMQATPPEMIEIGAPNQWATAPASSSPSCGPPMKNIMFTE